MKDITSKWADIADPDNETMKKIVDGLRGIHTYLNYGGITPTPEYMERIAKNQKVSEHPIVRVHPESKEKVLWVSPKFLLEIVGMTPTESNAILAMLKAHAIRPEFTYRLRWRPGSVVMWDNRSTAHLAPRDLQRDYHDRKLFRTTLVGDLPVGVDGQQSKALEGSPLLAA